MYLGLLGGSTSLGTMSTFQWQCRSDAGLLCNGQHRRVHHSVVVTGVVASRVLLGLSFGFASQPIHSRPRLGSSRFSCFAGVWTSVFNQSVASLKSSFDLLN